MEGLGSVWSSGELWPERGMGRARAARTGDRAHHKVINTGPTV